MKNTKHQSHQSQGERHFCRRWAIMCSAAVAIAAVVGLAAARRDGYVVHEWGTFTSVQGGDGVLLNWNPLETSRLPKFVYDFRRPGLGRMPVGAYLFGKGQITGLQRMETPVIYFYSPKEQEVNVSVDFPQGVITEWFPQATQIGPTVKVPPPALMTADKVLHRAGVKPEFTVESLIDQSTSQQSRARWAHIRVLPAQNNQKLNASLPGDQSGSHYFSARETDAAFVQIGSTVATNPAPEVEKFIFYRGVGSFSTPLAVRVSSSAGQSIAVTITNTGNEKLDHLFLLRVEKGAGKFVPVKMLRENKQLTVQFDGSDVMPVKAVSEKLAAAMKDSLVKAGLYPREAAAMVATWKDSWFEEDGFRVLYVLPRRWTDKTLPLKLDPAPETVTRVMVGRAEVLTPASQQQLVKALTDARMGDAQGQQRAAAELKQLGRFAEPALVLASQTAPEAGETGWKLLRPVSPFE
jgi:hypothetical protein